MADTPHRRTQTGVELQHDDALDGLRAIAVGAVVLTHTFSDLFPGGWCGVDVFFVLSGFLITTILRRELEASGAICFRAFYIRRTLRLLPALVLFLCAGLVVAAAKDGALAKALPAAAFAITYTMNWNLAFEWGPSWLFAHTWSLAIEEQFYLLWPVLVVLLNRKATSRWLFLALVVEIIWRTVLVRSGATPIRTYAGFDTHSDGLIVGCLIAVSTIPQYIERWLPVFGVAAAVVLAVICFTLAYESPWTSVVGIPAASVASGFILLCARRDGWFRRFLNLPVLGYVGRISYGIYLWHFLLMMTGMAVAGRWGLIAGAAASIPVAAASYEFYEKRILRLKDKLAPRATVRVMDNA